MSSEGYGDSVDRDGIDSTLQPTLLQRLAVEVLLDSLTPATTTSVIDSALWDLRERLADAELTALRTFGISHRYLVIRPINSGTLPGHEDLDKITAAIRTLASMGLITGDGLGP
jgi:hypothetical protein